MRLHIERKWHSLIEYRHMAYKNIPKYKNADIKAIDKCTIIR